MLKPLFHLVKKEFLLVKSYLPAIILITIAIPLFINAQLSPIIGKNSGAWAYCLETIFVQFIISSSASLIEAKYPKAQALLSATPYTRKLLVVAKYSFILMMFLYSTLMFAIFSILSPKYFGDFHVSMIGPVFLFVCIFFGIVTPLEYKIGYEKTKYVYTLALVIIPFIVSRFSTLSDLIRIKRLIENIPVSLQFILPILLACFIGLVSIITSIRIYSKKEL
ncbi:ABC-2 transporter permease [Paenibacillus sp. YN15]|uniref:ABC-2 transporter permease n=1 Tax=Paenibacillus sp. YN15 TaxID=1742774 RepID=UPI000DCD8C85|nr:ABC-2 transporter permease [Paenibacillus sp. YN15]RAU90920.1 hypothetical protein DQG13_30155 [Paenibacillus sp. YN15]